MQYFILMLDYGHRGMEAIVHPEDTRSTIIDRAREAIGDGTRIVHVKFVDGDFIEDITEEIVSEAKALMLEAAE